MIHRIFALIAGAALIFHIGALAADSKPNCDSPEVGAEVVACAAARHGKADAEMNRAYLQLRTVLLRRNEIDVAEHLKQSQRDWLRFLKSHCEFEATYEGAGGSSVSAKMGDCMAYTTVARTKYLEGLLQFFK
jgi:uncharacterized protein YecT (DUF1311 family)